MTAIVTPSTVGMTPPPMFRGSLRATIMLAVIVAAPAIAYAQQGCRAPTGAASRSVTRFLQSPPEHFWLRAHGITATHVADLAPLTNPADSALCVRMDSTLAPDTAYYYRAGGYVIGTIAQPLVVGQLRPDFGSPIFIFDSAGTEVHSGGIRVRVAQDVRVVSTVDGRVVLAWTAGDRDLATLRLQRAGSTGSFADVGEPLSLTVASATDTTPIPGTLHRYRLAGTDATGDSGSSNVVWASLADIGKVTRARAGPRLRDRSSRAGRTPGPNVVCSARTVTISGLPRGYALRVGGILSGLSSGTGQVRLELRGTPIPAAQLEILNDVDTVVKTHSPPKGVCGGDMYVLTPP